MVKIKKTKCGEFYDKYKVISWAKGNTYLNTGFLVPVGTAPHNIIKTLLLAYNLWSLFRIVK